jgi:hypothetical protein
MSKKPTATQYKQAVEQVTGQTPSPTRIMRQVYVESMDSVSLGPRHSDMHLGRSEGPLVRVDLRVHNARSGRPEHLALWLEPALAKTLGKAIAEAKPFEPGRHLR